MSTSSKPIALTDQQLDAIHRAAWPLAPEDRSRYLAAVMEALQAQQHLGDGSVYRIAVEMQRRFWTPPTLERKTGNGKWSR